MKQILIKTRRLTEEMINGYVKTLLKCQKLCNKYPATVLVLGIVSNEGDVMPSRFLLERRRANYAAYIDVMQTFIKP